MANGLDTDNINVNPSDGLEQSLSTLEQFGLEEQQQQDARDLAEQQQAETASMLGTINLLNQADPSTPAVSGLTRQDLFPSFDQPIQVGQSSSRTLGSQPIFAATGGLFPFGVLEKREAALQAQKEAKKRSFKAFDIPAFKTSDKRFQGDISNQITSAVQSERERLRPIVGVANEDEALRRSDRLRVELQNIELLATQADQVTGTIAKLEDDIAKGDVEVSPAVRGLLDDFKDVTQGSVTGEAASLRPLLNQIEGFSTIDRVLNEQKVIDKIEASVTESLAGVRDRGDFKTLESVRKESVKDQAAIIGAQLKRSQFKDSPITEDQIVSHIESFFGEKEERTAKIIKDAKKGKGDVTEDEVQDRIRTIETLQKAFFDPEGNITDNINNEAQKVVATLVGGELSGFGDISDARFEKGVGGEGDAIVLTVPDPEDKTSTVERRLDLTDKATFIELNGILNTSPSETLKIKNESFRGQGRRTNIPDKPKNVRRVTQAQVDKAAKDNNLSVPEYVAAIKEQTGKIIEVVNQ